MDQDYEVGRLDALRRLGLLDTPPSEAFDRITRMASQIFALSISAVSLTDFDRQWFKSRVGLDLKAIPRRLAPCAAVAATRKSLVVENLLDDETYRESFLADAGVRFYAGAPLTTREGFCLGSMCVLGMSPRQVSTTEMDSLSDLAAMVMSQIELQHAFGRVDPLSSMPNRNQFLEDLDDLARDRPQRERRLAVMVDLATPEQLSVAARVMGPAYLDEMVQEAAQMIRTGLGAGLKPYHIAPTQFVFIAPPEVEEQGFDELLAQTLHPLSNRLDPRFMTTMVIGGAPFTLGQARPRDVLRTVHSAAQDARGAHTRISLYSSVHDAIHRRRFQILQEFRAALESGDQMRLVYQPRVDIASGVCHGAEALLRWQHPTLGEISPGEFIPLVEQTSMARATTAWVLEAALRQLARWRDTGFNLQLSVNVSAANLVEQDFVTRALDGLQRYALPAACLELEVTESAVMGDAGQALAVLEALANTGIRLAIDDFGTGYSSLSYLQRLPAHVVKIDQSFMQEVEGDERTRGLVTAMIALSHDLGYRVVAEGVETTRTLEILRQAGCDEVQGYLFGRPMPAEALEQWCAGAELAVAC